jgi:uncharacterized protein (TIGR03118 family)
MNYDCEHRLVARAPLARFAVTSLAAILAAACGGSSGGGGAGTITGNADLTADASADAATDVVSEPFDAAALPGLVVKQTNLVSDQADADAAFVDPNALNTWGLAFNPSGIVWLADNGTGLLTVYAPDGTPQPLVVTVPAPGDGGKSTPTGMVFNPTTDFQGDLFIADTEDGTVAGWQTQSGTTAVIRADLSGSGALYKGLALVSTPVGNVLLATNFRAGTVDIFDKNYQTAPTPTQFVDSGLPSGYAPFNVVNIGTSVYVTYAKQDAQKVNDVPGAGNGFVDVFDTSGTLTKRLISNGLLNSPWGVALAPATFGSLANMLLVGNLGDGRINAFDPVTGQARGRLVDTTSAPLVIDGLWSLSFGASASADAGASDAEAGADAGTKPLWFTAGPAEYTKGLFGRLDLVP